MKFGFTDLSRDMDAPLELGWKHMLQVLWRDIFTLIRANLCFLLFCIPVVTIPAALTALHGICFDMVRGEKCQVFATYLRTIRKEFFSSLCSAFGMGLLLWISITGAAVYYQLSSGQKLLLLPMILMTAIAVILFLMLPYIFCMLARADLKWWLVWKDAFLVTFLNLKFSVLSGVVVLAFGAVEILYWLRALPFTLLVGVSLPVYFASYFSIFGLQRYVLNTPL